MKKIIKQVTKWTQNSLEQFGVRIIRSAEYYDYKEKVGKLADYQRWALGSEYPNLQSWVCANMEDSHAQLQQDLVAHFVCTNPGFYIEFGASNGLDLSNTYLLESKYQWAGILSEPGRNWHKDLAANRTAIIDQRAVASKTGETRNFLEASEGEYSTLEEYSASGSHQHTRNNAQQYTVETVSLNDLLEQNKSPRHIQLISIDTEGSELEILENFDFNKYYVELFFIEHNYSVHQGKIDSLLESKGFKKFLPSVSQFDGWYINQEIEDRLG
jgi:FkbM family methyltransferase